MDLETAQTTTTAKLPILKQEMETLNNPAAKTTTNADGISTSLITGPITTEENVQKKNDVKARSMLLMALPNEHLLTFNQYKDANTSLQKIVSQLAILGENISQEDLNLKFLKSLPSEWNTHVVVWRNKHDLDTMSFDDLITTNCSILLNKRLKELKAQTQLNFSATVALVPKVVNTARPNLAVVNAIRANQVNAAKASAYFKEFDGGYVTFGGGAKGGKITGKGTLKTGKLDFEDVYFVKELHLMNKKYCLVVTDDYSRFTWVFFLASKDETSGILKNFITEIENLVDKKVKIIRCDNGTEFKNRVMNEFCEQKGIKREYSVARTPQQNGVAERRNRTLIEAARTMLADSKLPTTFWAEAVNTACYVQNRVIIVKPHNKTPYELFRGRTPALSFMRPFGCHVSILNTLDHLGKFDGKSDDGFFVGYSLTSKAFRVYNIRTRKVEENLHIRFLEDKPIVSGNGPKWLFDIDSLTKSMNYVPVIAGTNSNDFAGSEVSIGEGTTSKETNTSQDYIVMPLWKDSSLFDSPSMDVSHDKPEPSCDAEKKDDEGVSKASGVDNQERPESSTPNINTVGPSINTAIVTTGNIRNFK
ncbi:putative ribonuclease H-like domain-containing protein [Tanacetum coccineum]